MYIDYACSLQMTSKVEHFFNGYTVINKCRQVLVTEQLS